MLSEMLLRPSKISFGEYKFIPPKRRRACKTSNQPAGDVALSWATEDTDCMLTIRAPNASQCYAMNVTLALAGFNVGTFYSLRVYDDEHSGAADCHAIRRRCTAAPQVLKQRTAPRGEACPPELTTPVDSPRRIVPTTRRSNHRVACRPQAQWRRLLACLPSDGYHTYASSAYSRRSRMYAGPDAHKSGCTMVRCSRHHPASHCYRPTRGREGAPVGGRDGPGRAVRPFDRAIFATQWSDPDRLVHAGFGKDEQKRKSGFRRKHFSRSTFQGREYSSWATNH